MDAPVSMECLNCGEHCEGNFCPNCGQPTDTSRTTWKTLSTTSLADMSRFRGPFYYTCWMILRRPWRVIADYTRCRRARYCPPLLFLLTLGLYSLLTSMGVEACYPPAARPEGELSLFLKFYQFSPGMFALTVSLPFLLAFMTVYRRPLRRHHYNMPEVITAVIWLCSMMFLTDIVQDLIALIIWACGLRGPRYDLQGDGAVGTVSGLIFLVYMMFMVVACMVKAFPRSRWWAHVLRLLTYIVLSFIFFVLLFGLMSVAFIRAGLDNVI